jgi:hypothetical protein
MVSILFTSALLVWNEKRIIASENPIFLSSRIITRYFNQAITPLIGPLFKESALTFITTIITSYTYKPF